MQPTYPIFEIIINDKFAKKQKTSWEDRKRIIYEILDEINQNNLFKKEDKEKEQYNLIPYYTDNTRSVGEKPLQEGSEELIDWKIFTDSGFLEMTNENFKDNSLIFYFRIGLVHHSNITLFEEGQETELWGNLNDSKSGRLCKTSFGIIVSNQLKKILVIKLSHIETVTCGILEHYFEKKSITYQQESTKKTIKIIPIKEENDFTTDDVDSVSHLEIGIDGELIQEYERKAGETDAFFTLILAPLRNLLSGGRTSKLFLDFKEEGDDEAIRLFNELYSSYETICGEELDRIFTHFKVHYESRQIGGEKKVNFKTRKRFAYEPSGESDSFNQIINAYNWFIKRKEEEDSDGV